MGKTPRDRDSARSAAGSEARALKIAEATERAGKTYAFDERHDGSRPIGHWFQQSDEGLILFVVFYTRACRWSLCTGCNLPSVSSRHAVDYFALIRQIDHVFGDADVVARASRIRKLIVSNNGSVLDEETFPSTAMMYLIARINLTLPAVRVVSFETRPEYVDVAELEFLSRAMRDRGEPACIELAIGFEAFDEHVRNKVFLKGLSLRAFEALVRKIEHPHFRLKCYFMQKPVTDMSDDAAVQDIRGGIDYLSAIAARHTVPINLHLNPTYVARGTPLERAFRDGRYAPPRLHDVARAALHAEGKPITVFVGLNDEGLAVEGGSFVRDGDEPLVEQLERFNRSQDHRALADYCRRHGRGA